MELFNGTKLALDATQSLDRDGRPWLVAVAKGTYRIPADLSAVPEPAERPRGLLYTDVFEGEEGLSSPLFESDLAPFKPACDVLVKGRAHAPQGRPVTELLAGLTVGPLKKSVRVVGNRYWIKGATGWLASDPEPFVQMPITYGRAFGGPPSTGAENPEELAPHPGNLVGQGFARGKAQRLLEGRPLPNLEAVDAPVTDPGTLYAPVSLGPISRSWTPRKAWAGTFDKKWRDEVFPLLPSDFDERFHQCAPPDQHIPYPTGAEEVSLLNLSPGGGLVRFRLPDLSLPMVALSRRRTWTELRPVVDTLAIDMDAGTFDVVWRARLALRRDLHEVETVVAGSVCKRWWKSRVYGTSDCGCGGVETSDEDLAPVTRALD